MKNFHFLALVALATVLFSCEKPFTGLELDKTSITFSAEGGSQTLKVKAGTPWTIEIPADLGWCSVSPKSGTTSADVTVTAQPNKMKDADRSFELVVNYEGGQDRVTVSQTRDGGEPVFSISQKSFEVPAEGGEISFTVVSDAVDYEITVVDKWVTEVSREGNRYDGETLKFSIAGNEGKARTGVISVCTKDGSCIPVSVSQAAFPGPYYAHLNSAFRFTAVWCGHCPYMDETFKLVKSRRDDFDFITIHGSDGYPLYFADSNTLMNAYNVSGFPTGVVNGWQEFNNSHNVESNANALEDVLDKFDKTFACVAGVSVSSSIADGKINVEAQVESSISGEYLVSAFLLESGIVEEQTLFPDGEPTKTIKDFVHDNVARKTLTKSVKGDSFEAVAGTPQSFNWSVSLDKTWKKDQLSVAVLVHRPYTNVKKPNKKYPDYYVVNANVAPAGKSVAYKYAE